MKHYLGIKDFTRTNRIQIQCIISNYWFPCDHFYIFFFLNEGNLRNNLNIVEYLKILYWYFLFLIIYSAIQLFLYIMANLWKKTNYSVIFLLIIINLQSMSLISKGPRLTYSPLPRNRPENVLNFPKTKIYFFNLVIINNCITKAAMFRK